MTVRKMSFMFAFAKLSVKKPGSVFLYVCVCLCPTVLGKIRSAVGSAQLLMSQKFQQFYWLCQQNLVSMFVEKDTVSTALFKQTSR